MTAALEPPPVVFVTRDTYYELVCQYGPTGGATRAVLLALRRYLCGSGFAWPSVRTLARAAGVHARTVQRALQRAADAGWVWRRELARSPNLYWAAVPESIAAAAKAAPVAPGQVEADLAARARYAPVPVVGVVRAVVARLRRLLSPPDEAPPQGRQAATPPLAECHPNSGKNPHGSVQPRGGRTPPAGTRLPCPAAEEDPGPGEGPTPDPLADPAERERLRAELDHAAAQLAPAAAARARSLAEGLRRARGLTPAQLGLAAELTSEARELAEDRRRRRDRWRRQPKRTPSEPAAFADAVRRAARDLERQAVPLRARALELGLSPAVAEDLGPEALGRWVAAAQRGAGPGVPHRVSSKCLTGGA